MSIENVIKWYDENVNYSLNETFLKYLIEVGIVKTDIDLEQLNLFLLCRYNNEFVKNDNNKFKLKENRIKIITNCTYTENVKQKNKNTEHNNTAIKQEKNTTNKKFKIENLGGKKMKLIKA